MFCTNCGKEIDGKFCTNCGAKNESKMIPLIISREKRMMGCAISFTVYVDGKNIGQLKNGGSLTCNITPGEHNVIVKSLEKEVNQNILVKEDNTSVEVITSLHMGFLAGRAVLKNVIYK